MLILLIVFGLLSGSLLSILVGLIGRNRRIGFGWSFIASLLLTPLIGLIITLLSDPLPYNSERSWGCLGTLLGIIGLLLLIVIIMAIFGLGIAALATV